MSRPHESAELHVSGAALYTDDLALPAHTLHGAYGLSEVAHGRLCGLELEAARQARDVVDVLTAADVPGVNNYGGIVADDPIFADGEVHYAGQPLFLVVAHERDAARRAARLASARVEPLPAILDIRAAIAAESFVLPSKRLVRGDPDAELARAPQRLSGSVGMGGQDHFYLEGQVAVALPQEDGGMHLWSSTQHPSEVQHLVAAALGVASHAVSVSCRRMGGGFGGKESQPAMIACAAAVAARRSGRPVKIRLDRDIDMLATGKRHDFLADYDVGFDGDGRIRALSVMLASRCGYSADLSGPVNDRAVCHLDNAYFIPHVAIVSHRCRTNTVSNTAFRGFGGPQGMMVIEHILDDIARHLGCDPLAVRRVNLYGIGERNVTPYGQIVEDNILPDLLEQLASEADYAGRRRAVAEWNEREPVIKRGLALTPVKFGIYFTKTSYNQAGALLQIYRDGTMLLNHGGTEMGQGLHTKVLDIVARELGVPNAWVRITATDTSKVPNTSATAASSGSDLNGKAAQDAARTLRERLAAFVRERDGVEIGPEDFDGGRVQIGANSIPFAELVEAAYRARISLSATGFYRTPKIHWDMDRLMGRPFYYFAYGAAIVEAAVDTLTGESRLLALDILHDVGHSLNPAIDIGQIEGGFMQGVGWLTSEQLYFDSDGALRTHAPSTYKIPTARDWPERAEVRLFGRPNPEETIYRSKAVGEPPLMLAIAALHAIRDAVAATPGGAGRPRLMAPAVPEAVLRAMGAVCELSEERSPLGDTMGTTSPDATEQTAFRLI